MNVDIDGVHSIACKHIWWVPMAFTHLLFQNKFYISDVLKDWPVKYRILSMQYPFMDSLCRQ